MVFLILVFSSFFFKETLALPVFVKSFFRFENFSSTPKFMLCTNFRLPSKEKNMTSEVLGIRANLRIFPYKDILLFIQFVYWAYLFLSSLQI